MLKKSNPLIKELCKCFAWLLTLIVIVFASLKISSALNYNKDCSKIAEDAIYAMYNFNSIEQLDYQMYDLQQLTTKAVFSQLTIDNTDRALNTYLKFKNNPVSVEILESSNHYVIYTLHSDSILEGRKFAFFYNVNSRGLIDKVREAEIIDFVQNSD